MTYDLNDNKKLIAFFNQLFIHEEITNIAPSIMKFFIITRNYGLDNAVEYIERLYNNDDINNLIVDAIKNGFQKDNIEFNNSNLIDFVTKNFFENGFYFHSFPGVYQDSINKNGLLANKRNPNDEIYYQIIKKYQFGPYYEKSENRICITEKLDNNSTTEYAIYTPEWLELFLKMGSNEIHHAFERGNLEEMLDKSKDALINIQRFMKQNPNYDENDYLFLVQYINDIIYKRFASGNNQVGICLIPRKNVFEYFEPYKPINYNDNKTILNRILNEIELSKKQIIDFMISNLSAGERTTNKNIPRELFEIITYNIPKKELSNRKVY